MQSEITSHICNRCILDSTIPNIHYDEKGICNFCRMHDVLDQKYPLNEEGRKKFDLIIEGVKKNGQGKEYDCVVGISGGRDSSYTLYIAKKMGLRPIAVHFDNGWNTEISVRNIKNATERLEVDLHTHVADWEEFKDLQIAFLKASVSDVEVPTDFAIISVLYEVAKKYGIKNILIGHSFRTEGIAPLEWTYIDAKYIRSIYKLFGKKKKITSFPLMSMTQLIYYTFFSQMNVIHVPEFIEYEHDKVNKVLTEELGWQYYGGHHHESTYTEFIQSYLLPKKFNIDKRKIEFSALIRSGQMTRDDALNELKKPYPYRQDLIPYVMNKMGLSQQEFEDMLAAPPKSFHDYPSYYPMIQLMKYPIWIACKFDLLPQVFYEKYIN
jgi:N-acetyl sugar amidotransferase